MRLIDADKYKKQLCENCIAKLEYGETFCPCGRVLDIDYFPTSYDVDKVVEDLGEATWQYNPPFNDEPYRMVILSNKAVQIVKRGGVDE